MGVISPGVATQTMPNPKIWQSADRAVGWVIAGTLDDANRCSPGLPILQAQVAGLLFGLLGGASFVSSIYPAAGAVLHWQDSWNYARFVDYATECSFLHKVGSGYIFVHRQLREHFAAMSP
ncbi:MAG: hypothetical protein BRC55_14440 [Cyanobacteria bacterium SW_8_48_13]|nr:MAG: hypothetical protein BRC55_14440 [Cyanobacteria bacterium SW_8_48_13]